MKYRILQNKDEKYAIQKRVFLFWMWMDHSLQTTSLEYCAIKFDTLDKAEDFLKTLDEDYWKVVK